MDDIRKYVLIILLIGISLLSFAQDRNDLEKKKKQLQKDINYAGELLKETKKNKRLSQNQLVTLNIKISMREDLIATIRAEVRLLNKHIAENESIIEAMENDLKQLKEEYAKMIYYAYKNKNAYDRLMFIFSADDFNQAYKRLKYMQQYSEYRQKQAAMIKKTQEILDKKTRELRTKKSEKQNLLFNERSEKNNLVDEKKEQQTVLSKLQTKEKQIKKDLRKKQNEAKKLQKAIERIIAEEIRKAKEAGKMFFSLTPEAKKLSANFVSNKGNLPWPVEKGVITGYFGEHPHPILKGIKVKNNGIDIGTTKGSSARAVFDGEVSGVVIIPGAGKAVLVRHGEYLSVYSNLQEVFVEKGNKIKTKQELGIVITDEIKGKTELHIEIWKATPEETRKLNPVYWIYKAVDRH